MMRTRKLALLGIPALLAGAHFLYWRMTSDRLEEGLAIWRAQRQRAGWTVEAGAPRRGGYPMAATLSLPAVRLRGDGRELPAPLVWQAERVVLRVNLAQPWLLRVQPEGEQQLRVADGPDIPFRAEHSLLSVPLDPVAAGRGELRLSHLRAETPGAAQLRIGATQVSADLNPTARRGEAAVVFSIRAQGITLPNSFNWALGPDVARLDMDGTFGGPLPRATTPRLAATQWRDNGGTLDISALGLQWGKLSLNATASMALDGQLQPVGTATARITGQNEALDALAASGVLPQRTAEMVKTMITLFTQQAAGAGSDSAVQIPLSLSERRLFTRQVPLARLPVLAWPAR